MEIVGNSFHPCIVCVARIIYIPLVYLWMEKVERILTLTICFNVFGETTLTSAPSLYCQNGYYLERESLNDKTIKIKWTFSRLSLGLQGFHLLLILSLYRSLIFTKPFTHQASSHVLLSCGTLCLLIVFLRIMSNVNQYLSLSL